MRKIYKIAILAVILVICIITKVYGQSLDSKKQTIYKIGDNTTLEINESDIDTYINDTYSWSIEPTTLMYAADGRTSWIWQSEVDTYTKAGWSINPPVIIFSEKEDRVVLQEEVGDYLATGKWFRTYEEAHPITISMNIFQKTNIPPEELDKILSKGLSGCGKLFYEMEQRYGVNSIFAISVAELESGNGTSYAFKNKNNAFGIGPGKRFDSVESCIDFFGNLMHKPLYYGKSIDAVGTKYCVGGNWANKVKSLMNANYSGLGY